MQALAWSFNVGLTIVHKIVHETCTAIWEILSPTNLKTPSTEEEWLNIEKEFFSRWDFPHCLGSIDGKHINIQAPTGTGSLHYNYKHFFSLFCWDPVTVDTVSPLLILEVVVHKVMECLKIVYSVKEWKIIS